MGSQSNRFDTRADAELERVTNNVLAAAGTRSATRVYGLFNYCFTCNLAVGFMDLGNAVWDNAPADVLALPHRAFPDPFASRNFRALLANARIPSWYTPTITDAQTARADITRVVHEHNYLAGHFPETPNLAPPYFWNDDARYALVTDTDTDLIADITKEKSDVLEGFQNPVSVSDVLRAIPRTTQYDTDLLLVDPISGVPLVWVELTKTKKTANATLNVAVSLSRVLDTPLLHVLWERETVTVIYLDHGVWSSRVRTKVSDLTIPVGAHVADTMTDWIRNRTPRGTLINHPTR